jgi:hypothetical protein
VADQVVTYEALRSGPLNKGFLSGPTGTRYQRVLGRAMDRELDRLTWARRSRWPDWAPSDALLYIGGERGLEQVVIMGRPTLREPEPDYRGRLRGAWYIWQEAGSQQIHVDAFRWTGLTNVTVHRRKDWSFPDDASAPSPYVRAFQHSVWSQFDILVDKPLPWQIVRWGDGHNWGGPWTWGTTATQAEVEQLRRLARRFASGHDTPMWLVLAFGNGRVWGGWVWGDGGLWGGGDLPTVRWLVGEEHWRTRGLTG